MQGNIDFTGSLSGSIAGGGGGGSDVTITPILETGTKIADYEIDSTPGELYAPTPPVVPEHIVNDIHGFSYTHYPSTEIARYTIDEGTEQSIFAPDYETTWEAYPGVDQDYTIGILRCYGSTYNVKIPYYQRPLTAGVNITIDQDNVISASNTSINYSTTEKVIGTWIDGKPLYQKTIEEIFTTSNQQTLTISGIDSTMDCKNYKGRFDYEYNNVFYPSALGANLNMYPADDFSKIKTLSIMTGTYRVRVTITLEYTKTTD